MQKNSENSLNIKMIKSRKVGYKIPDILMNKLENMPAPEDFYKGYPEKHEEIPLWWSRDIDLPLTKKANRKSKKKALLLKNALEEQARWQEEANKRFQKLLLKQENEHQKRCEILDKQIKEKKEELELIRQKNKLEYQNKLLSLELKLQKTNLEKDFYEKEREKLKELEKQTKEIYEEQLHKKEALADIDEDLKNERKETEKIKYNVQKQYINKGFNPPHFSRNDDKTMDESSEKLESFDEKDILDVKHLTLFNTETNNNELQNISFDVKKQGATILYSSSEKALKLLHLALTKRLPADIHLLEGDIRYNGNSIYRQDSKGNKDIIDFTDIENKIALSNKGIFKIFHNYNYSSKKCKEFMDVFNLKKNYYYKKPKKITKEQNKKMALALCLSLNNPLIIMHKPEENITQVDKTKLIDLLNSQKNKGAVIIITADRELSGAVNNSALYTF